MRHIPTRLIFAVGFGLSTLTWAAPASPPPALLPQSFAGWTQVGALATTSPAADAAVLNEYGIVQYAAATYQSGTHRFAVRAMRFGDATGAYGDFTLARQPNMHAEKLGREGARANGHFVFWTGTTVVDATFTDSSGDENTLSALVALLPPATGTRSIPPSLPHYLPAAQLTAASVRYAIGPAAYARAGGTLPPGVVDFSQDTEAVLAQYGPPGAQETLTLLLYPTPQIAGAHLKTIAALAPSSGLATKRSGPLVAIANGSYSAPRAQQLVGAVRFNDAVTVDHPEGYVPETVKLYRLLYGITMLVVVLFGAALLLGIFLGGGRALIRMLRGKPASTVGEEEFISLHLSR
ncbi:MAG TPA: DUF6599 family protein [Acidobacteriaceae bacterium]|jgi:hypothetical protein|nr:DUF6599 family protein [Acidobacteriaceae bacterium]